LSAFSGAQGIEEPAIHPSRESFTYAQAGGARETFSSYMNPGPICCLCLCRRHEGWTGEGRPRTYSGRGLLRSRGCSSGRATPPRSEE
jgi:hypothetical protein